MKAKSLLLTFSLLLLVSLSFAQVEKETLESGGVTNNITATHSGMYDGTESKEAEAFFDKAADYGIKQDYKNAEKFYLKAIKKDPGFVEAYDNLGRVYRRIGDLEKAIEYYSKSIEMYPDGSFAHQNLAVVYGIQKKYAEAAKEYEEILRINPVDPEGFFGLANSYMMLEDFDKALSNATEAVKLYEASNSHHLSDGYYLTGLIHFYEKNNEEARKYMLKAKENGAKIDPKLEAALFDEEQEETATKENLPLEKEDFIKLYDWLLETPVGTEPDTRKMVSALVFQWMTDSPDVTVELSEGVVPYMKSGECLLIFMGGWSKYELQTDAFSKVDAAMTGTENVIKFYLANKKKIGKNKHIENLIKLQEGNKLKQFIQDNM